MLFLLDNYLTITYILLYCYDKDISQISILLYCFTINVIYHEIQYVGFSLSGVLNVEYNLIF